MHVNLSHFYVSLIILIFCTLVYNISILPFLFWWFKWKTNYVKYICNTSGGCISFCASHKPILNTQYSCYIVSHKVNIKNFHNMHYISMDNPSKCPILPMLRSIKICDIYPDLWYFFLSHITFEAYINRWNIIIYLVKERDVQINIDAIV